MTCARCGKLCTVYNSIFSATPHGSCLLFRNICEFYLIISVNKTDLNLIIYWYRYCWYTRCIICHIAYRSQQYFKIKFHNTLDLVQTVYAQNDKESKVDFNNSVFLEEAKTCSGFMSFRAPSKTLKQKNHHNSPYMQLIITLLQVLFQFIKRHLLTIVAK